MALKIAILGGASERRHWKIPKGWEVWGLNVIFPGWLEKPPNRMFNIHRYKLLKRYGYDVQRELEWANYYPETEWVLADRWPHEFPNFRIFPREKLVSMPRGQYHCGSFDWMVAYAVALGAKEVQLHGVRLGLSSSEPRSSRPCLEYWCGFAEAMGTRITVAPDCDLFYYEHAVLSNRQYGYDDAPIFQIEGKRGAPYRYDRGRK